MRKWENEIAQLHSFFLSLSLSLSLSVSLSLLTPEKVASIMDVVFVGRRSVTRLRSQPEIYCTASTSLWRETAWSSFRASSCWMEATDAAGVTGLSSILSHISYLLYLITCECVCVCVCICTVHVRVWRGISKEQACLSEPLLGFLRPCLIVQVL